MVQSYAILKADFKFIFLLLMTGTPPVYAQAGAQSLATEPVEILAHVEVQKPIRFSPTTEGSKTDYTAFFCQGGSGQLSKSDFDQVKNPSKDGTDLGGLCCELREDLRGKRPVLQLNPPENSPIWLQAPPLPAANLPQNVAPPADQLILHLRTPPRTPRGQAVRINMSCWREGQLIEPTSSLISAAFGPILNPVNYFIPPEEGSISLPILAEEMARLKEMDTTPAALSPLQNEWITEDERRMLWVLQVKNPRNLKKDWLSRSLLAVHRLQNLRVHQILGDYELTENSSQNGCIDKLADVPVTGKGKFRLGLRSDGTRHGLEYYFRTFVPPVKGSYPDGDFRSEIVWGDYSRLLFVLDDPATVRFIGNPAQLQSDQKIFYDNPSEPEARGLLVMRKHESMKLESDQTAILDTRWVQNNIYTNTASYFWKPMRERSRKLTAVSVQIKSSPDDPDLIRVTKKTEPWSGKDSDFLSPKVNVSCDFIRTGPANTPE